MYRKIKLFVLFFMLTFVISCGQQRKYVEYKVKEGETMRSIAKELDMKVKDLLRLNPNVGRRPSANTNIVIPNTKKSKFLQKQEVVEKAKDSIIEPQVLEEVLPEYITHTIQKGDTFYSLTRFYNVSKSALLTLNPTLSETELKIGEEIRIKLLEETTENLLYKDTIAENTELKLALLLPFKTSYYDTIATEDIFLKKNRLVNIVSDFYLGVDFAIDSLKKQGVSVDLNVFDTERKNSKIRTILAENNLNENDVIIGPIYSDEAKIVANAVEVPVIFPVYSKNQSQFTSPRIVKTSPDNQRYKEVMLNYLDTLYTRQNIIVVSDSIRKASGDLLKTVTALQQYDSILQQNDTISKITVIIPKNGYIEKEILINALEPTVDNWVLIETTNNVFAADAINSLISLPTEEDIEKLKEIEEKKEEEERKEVTLQALPEDTVVKVFAFKKGTTFDKVAHTKLSKLNFTYGTDVFRNESLDTLQSFQKTYKAKNHTFPSYYALKGFDITYDILMRLASGKALKETFQEGASFRVESQFNFNDRLYETSENKGIFIIQYNTGLTLTRLE